MNKQTKKQLKIAIVSDAVYPYNIGGKEKRIYEINSRLVKKGHQVTIYCMKWWKGKSDVKKLYLQKNKNGSAITLKAISPLYPLYSGQRRSMKEAIMFSLYCLRLLHEDFDVIDVDHMPHLVLFTTKLVTLLKRKKMFVTWHEVWGKKYWMSYLGVSGILAYFIEKLSAKLPDKVISVSKHTTAKLKNDLQVKRPIYTITAGISLKDIQKIKPAKEKSDIIFAGRLMEHKHIDFLIKSIAKLRNIYPNIKCVIVGKGPEEQALKKLVDTLDLQNNVIFYDFLKSHSDLYALMKSSKVFAYPTTREGFGMAALEANASGIPVITTNHQENAAKDLIIDGENGSTVALNTETFNKKVSLYMTKRIESKKLIEQVKKFDWDQVAKQIEEVYYS